MTQRLSSLRSVALISVLLPLLAGCAGTPAIDTTKPVDPLEVMRLVEQRNQKVIALRGYGKISVESTEFSGGGSIQVIVLKPDSLQLEITGPFGVTVARGLVTDQSFQFYDGMNNTVSEGATTAQNLRRVLRFPIAFADILEILTGTLGFGAVPGDVAPKGMLSDGAYVLTWESEGQTLEYTVDLGTLAVRRFARRNEEGELLEEILFRDFREKSGIALPQIVSITRPMDEESLSIAFDRMTVNDLPVTFSFSYPKSARRISL
ncbi:MAG: DUF4292 domain-containing protein [Bacteroidetes bacterium]|nr:DUF4292 domain-containing protein [Bacteroidota bacterium]